MIDARHVEEAEVYRGDEPVGTLRRTPHGCVFRYFDDFFASHRGETGGLAVHLPFRQQIHEHRGDNLPPYFAGLLPEGLRLKALVQQVKTSEDDLLSLLIAGGPDTVGDVSVVPPGSAPTLSSPAVNPKQVDRTRFRDLWAKTLEHLGPGDIIVPGVQEKISPAMITFPLTAVSKRKGYVLKLNPSDRPHLVENEHFFMTAAAVCGEDLARA